MEYGLGENESTGYFTSEFMCKRYCNWSLFCTSVRFFIIVDKKNTQKERKRERWGWVSNLIFSKEKASMMNPEKDWVAA